MSERVFDYGQNPVLSLFGAIFTSCFAVVLLVILWDRIGDPQQARAGEIWVLGLGAGLSLVGAIVGLRQARRPGRDPGARLALTDTGIDYRPKMLFMRDAFVPYGDITGVKIVNEEGTVDLVVTHLGGSVTLHRLWFNDRNEFEVFAAMVSQRSGQELKRGWLT